jgi:hypothetical protein
VNEKPSTLSTVVMWLLVMLVAAVVLAHGTATGRRLIRETMPAHGSPGKE